MKEALMCVLCFLAALTAEAQPKRIESQFRIARLKYAGGGDWYNDPSSEVNLLKFAMQSTGLDVDPQYEFTEIADDKFFSYPFVFMTGHGGIVFSDYEVSRLRTYLTHGGFLYADDDYGMDKAFRREIKKVFPEEQLVELPFSYGLYHCVFDFPNGVPKTHEHNGKPPQGFGIFYKGRLVVYIPTNPIQATAGPTPMSTKTRRRKGKKRCGSGQTCFFGCSRNEA